MKIFLTRENTGFRRDELPSAGEIRVGDHRQTGEHVFREYRGRAVVAPTDEADTCAIHEYVHAVVRRGDWKLPHWFEEGLAEFYSRSIPIGKDQLSIGRRIPEHLAVLANQTLTAFSGFWTARS